MCRVTQNAAVNCHLGLIESSWYQTEGVECVLGAQSTDGLVQQNLGAVPQHDAVVVPAASGGRPADPQRPAVTERQHDES